MQRIHNSLPNHHSFKANFNLASNKFLPAFLAIISLDLGTLQLVGSQSINTLLPNNKGTAGSITVFNSGQKEFEKSLNSPLGIHSLNNDFFLSEKSSVI
jgi:hypothetical protein